MKRRIQSGFHLLVLLMCVSSCRQAPVHEERVKTDLTVSYEVAGILSPKSIHEVEHELTLGCEVLDRDYTDYQQYKEYLTPLGFKKIRLQAGWAKTEKEKGVYNFAWLDSIVDDAVGRGLKIWLQTSYGNPIYRPGAHLYI